MDREQMIPNALGSPHKILEINIERPHIYRISIFAKWRLKVIELVMVSGHNCASWQAKELRVFWKKGIPPTRTASFGKTAMDTWMSNGEYSQKTRLHSHNIGMNLYCTLPFAVTWSPDLDGLLKLIGCMVSWLVANHERWLPRCCLLKFSTTRDGNNPLIGCEYRVTLQLFVQHIWKDGAIQLEQSSMNFLTFSRFQNSVINHGETVYLNR